MKLTSPTTVEALMQRHELHFNKRFGQNFLIDDHILDKVATAGDLTSADTVIEVGPGIGTLTRELSARAGQVIAVEIDQKLIPVLGETLADCENVHVMNADVLKTDLATLVAEAAPDATSLKVVANLPYYITTPIIMQLLETQWPSGVTLAQMVFLVQKEVGERICADPGGKIYSSLSIACQYYARPEIAFTVPATVFMPRPKVDSIVIAMRKAAPPYAPTDPAQFFRVVKAAFMNRRKTLINSLTTNTAYAKDQLLAAMAAAGIDPKVRAEKLDGAAFCALANALIALEKSPDAC
ncbi:16S rRNA (adenine(1518)-N(6)/adenine(1519)-N(6))-dimethyltransferase RsmA [Pseudoramibacter faecis]|uniref:16S rRNA (adenine(1518)-N(6)/adenine(1519)-N(6))- dimethyltransferase RsmA n=1 Tax=Pseudoramibacter faecis TaxID=3108534 RepID=UPI002E79E612|nr:16S rRNA (adenine(1518)-N(6)/adenine(1519)-N(6))-dimethyltransferase RsmA [Pseudoramibacter sp. HA2172]